MGTFLDSVGFITCSAPHGACVRRNQRNGSGPPLKLLAGILQQVDITKALELDGKMQREVIVTARADAGAGAGADASVLYADLTMLTC